MTTYFHSSENQRDAAPMLFLRESWPSSNSEPPAIPSNMMMYMNYSSSSRSCTDALPGNSDQQNCTDISPLGASVSTPPQQEILSNLGGSRMVEHDFNGWGNGKNEMPFTHLMASATGIIQGVQNLQGQGLSLSLSTQIPSTMQIPSVEYQNPNSGFSSFLSPNLSISGEGSGRSASHRDDENSPNKQLRNVDYMEPAFLGANSDSVRPDMSSYRMSSFSRAIPNSKYLKAVQQLLDEVVNVRKDLKNQDSKKGLIKSSKEVDGGSKNETTLPPASGESSNPQEGVNNSPELSAAEKHDLQNKLTKLLSMLDEVDRRYKQYYHQMQIVVSSFDVMAGCGAAKPYTALALQTISRHFRSLHDAITGQIQVVRKSLGENDASPNSKGVGISRLRYVDQHLRQQKALQQLGMMQQHAWRPQRGLPESSVSILRAWLFEHFLHPYPKDSDKIMLARQTGLSRSQVSNWFINARVRLWKPMVEDMYKEEFGDAEMDSNSSSETAPRAAKGDINTSEEIGTTIDATFWSGACGGMGTEVLKSRGDEKSTIQGGGHCPNAIIQSDGGCGRFLTPASSYHISELGRHGNGSAVSLTLGLQHCEEGGVPMSIDTPHSFVTIRGDNVYNAESSSIGPQTGDFDCLDSGNRQHKFGTSHLFHDFVA